MAERVDLNIIPPSIADARGRAFGEVMRRAIAEPDFRTLLFERIDTVNSSVLPFLVREFSIEEFAEPDMHEDVVRGLLKAAFELHALKGYIKGVRRGLELIGMHVDWQQWFEATPPGAPGTHIVTVYVNRSLFGEQEALLDARAQKAALRMIDGMKRWSQEIRFQLGALFDGTLGVADKASATAARADLLQAVPRTDLSGELGVEDKAAITAATAQMLSAQTQLDQSLELGLAASAAATMSIRHTLFAEV